MGKDLKGKELGQGISQRKDGYYVGRYTSKNGKRIQKLFLKVKDCQKWLADNQYSDEHSNADFPQDMIVSAWYDYWISIKEKTVRPNTVRNYKERYNKNISPVIGNKLLKEVNTIHCQQIMNNMSDDGYKTTTIYQARIALYNMLDYAYQNDIIPKNPCNRMVKYDIGKPSEKKEALTIEEQKKFCHEIVGCPYEYQYLFILQTGLRTGELVALEWKDIDFKNKTMTISKTMEYRHSTKEWRKGEPKSKSGYRTIPLTDEAIRLLKLQKKKNQSLPFISLEWKDTVFVCKKGTPVKNSTYDTMLFKVCEKAGIRKIAMHILRPTFATRCIEAGMMPKTLQTLLGHSNIGITMNLYVHTTDDQKQKEISMVADALKVI